LKRVPASHPFPQGRGSRKYLLFRSVASEVHVVLRYDGRMPRFVLLFHDCPPILGKPSHWDLMLERDGALMTWNLAELPARWQTPSGRDVIELGAARLPDHRLAYLDYEGPVSSGRGEVKRIDRGDYEVVDESPEWLRVRLAGAVAIGEVRLPIAPPPPATTSLSSS
jgi:hypothetical protein